MNTLLIAAIEGKSLLSVIIWIIVIGVIVGLLFWLLDFIKLQEPFNRVAKVILVIVSVLLLINALLALTGEGNQFIRW